MSKILIEIPDNINYRNYDIPYFVLDAITSSTPIPDNATNGDMIKAIFPNCKDWKAKIEDNHREIHEVHFVQLQNSMTKYDESWWNMPYKAERKNKKMTNGKKILNDFPNATTRICKNKGFTYIELEQNDKWIADYDLNWWNEVYKEPTTINKGDCED